MGTDRIILQHRAKLVAYLKIDCVDDFLVSNHELDCESEIWRLQSECNCLIKIGV
jgi:hypothetical protein